jgi:hypothetical protein
VGDAMLETTIETTTMTMRPDGFLGLRRGRCDVVQDADAP